jgi:non-specific serine/threonine protein kinase
MTPDQRRRLDELATFHADLIRLKSRLVARQLGGPGAAGDQRTFEELRQSLLRRAGVVKPLFERVVGGRIWITAPFGINRADDLWDVALTDNHPYSQAVYAGDLADRLTSVIGTLEADPSLLEPPPPRQPRPPLPATTGAPGVARLLPEQDALRAALAWCLTTAPEPGLELAAALGPFWRRQVAHDEGARWLEALLARTGAGVTAGAPSSPGHPGPASHVRALYWLGRLLRELGETERARAPLTESLTRSRAVGDDEGTALALQQLGMVARADGRPEEARRCFEAALATFGEAGGASFRAVVQRDLGLLWLSLGDLPRAKESLAAHVAHARRASGRPNAGGVALVRLGVIARLEGDLGLARRYLEAALSDMRAAPAGRWEWAVAAAALGDLEAAAGNEARARAHFAEIVAEGQADGFGPSWELGLAGLGLLALRRGDHVRAAHVLGAMTPAQLTRTRMHAPYAVPPIEAGLAACRAALGEDAAEAARRAARAMPPSALAEMALEPPAHGRGRRRKPAARPAAEGRRGRGGAGRAAPAAPETPAWASPAARAAGLTPREWEVLALLVAGASNRAIAERLVISPHTAVRHVGSVVAKLGVGSRGAAVARATGRDDRAGPPARGIRHAARSA